MNKFSHVEMTLSRSFDRCKVEQRHEALTVASAATIITPAVNSAGSGALVRNASRTTRVSNPAMGCFGNIERRTTAAQTQTEVFTQQDAAKGFCIGRGQPRAARADLRPCGTGKCTLRSTRLWAAEQQVRDAADGCLYLSAVDQGGSDGPGSMSIVPQPSAHCRTDYVRWFARRILTAGRSATAIFRFVPISLSCWHRRCTNRRHRSPTRLQEPVT